MYIYIYVYIYIYIYICAGAPRRAGCRDSARRRGPRRWELSLQPAVVVRSGPFSVGAVIEGHAVGRGEVEAEVQEVVEVQVAVLLVAEDVPHDEEALLGEVWVAEADEAQRARAVEQLRDSEFGEVRLQRRNFSRSV